MIKIVFAVLVLLVGCFIAFYFDQNGVEIPVLYWWIGCVSGMLAMGLVLT